MFYYMAFPKKSYVLLPINFARPANNNKVGHRSDTETTDRQSGYGISRPFVDQSERAYYRCHIINGYNTKNEHTSWKRHIARINHTLLESSHNV